MTAFKSSCFIVVVAAAGVLTNGCAAPGTVDPPTASATPAPVTPVIHPEADRLLKQTCSALAAANRFSFKAEIWSDEVIGAGHKLATTKTIEVQVRRPNGLHAEAQSPKRTRGIWYDGKTVTILNRVQNLYGTVDAPATLDLMLDAVNDKYGITIPLDDLIVSDPYTSAIGAAHTGAYFGKVTVLGVPCHHIAFGTPAVDWQLWVEDGGTRMPRKLVITYKLEDTDPQYTAIFSNWSLNSQIPDSDFTFTPPSGSARIEVLAAAPEDE